MGSAALVDAKRRLFITASHVASDKDEIFFRLSALDETVRTGKILARKPALSGQDEESGTGWDQARDVLLFESNEDLPPAARSFELASLDWEYEDVSYFGFPGSSPRPVPGKAQLTSPSMPPGVVLQTSQYSCTGGFRGEVIGGDSGSALVANGYVVGIVTVSTQSGKLGRYIRAECISDWIRQSLQFKADPRQFDGIFLNNNVQEIKNLLSSRDSRNIISNVDMMSLMSYGTKTAKSLDNEKTHLLLKNLICPIIPTLSARRIKLEYSLLNEIPKQLVINFSQSLIKEAQKTRVSGEKEQTLVQIFAQAALDATLGSSERKFLNSAIKADDAGNLSGLVKSDDTAALWKVIADASLLLAQTSHKSNETLRYADVSRKSSAIAALSSDRSDVIAESLASFAQAARAGDDLSTAYKAIIAAKRLGLTAPWSSTVATTIVREIGPVGALKKDYTSKADLLAETSRSVDAM